MKPAAFFAIFGFLAASATLTGCDESNLRPGAMVEINNCSARGDCKPDFYCDERKSKSPQDMQKCEDTWHAKRDAQAEAEREKREAANTESARRAARDAALHPSEWHRLKQDAVGCIDRARYVNGEFAGHEQGCIEVQKGTPFLLQPTHYALNEGGSKLIAPLDGETATQSNMITSIKFPSWVFDRKTIHCTQRQVLMHTETTCDDGR